MSTKHEMRLRQMLMDTGLLQPLSSQTKKGTISVMCRSMKGTEPEWLAMVSEALTLAAEHKIDLHIGRKYVMKNGSLAFGWYIGVTAQNAKALDTAILQLAKVFTEGDDEPEVKASLAKKPKKGPPPQQYKSPYKTDKQVRKEVGIDPSDEEAGYIGVTREKPMNWGADGPGPHLDRVATGKAMGRDGKPMKTEVIEMPLPHMRGPLNVPKDRSSRGAYTAGTMPLPSSK